MRMDVHRCVQLDGRQDRYRKITYFSVVELMNLGDESCFPNGWLNSACY